MPTSLTNLPRETLAAGGGSFLVSLTLYGPRLIAAAILGEAAILVMGVGQTMNRFGQILSNSLSQTLIVLQKRAGFATGKATALLFGLQVIVLLAMIGTLPLWSHIFSYANGAENFGLAIVLLLIFGLASQFNYLLQSLNLVQHGPRVFIRGPLVFFMTFGAALLATWLLGELGLINLITCMLVARTVQIGYNLIQRRKGDGMT